MFIWRNSKRYETMYLLLAMNSLKLPIECVISEQNIAAVSETDPQCSLAISTVWSKAWPQVWPYDSCASKHGNINKSWITHVENTNPKMNPCSITESSNLIFALLATLSYQLLYGSHSQIKSGHPLLYQIPLHTGNEINSKISSQRIQFQYNVTISSLFV